MSLIDRLNAEVLEIEEKELDELEKWLERQRRKHHHCKIVSGRFDGPYTIGPNGEIIMATFQITVGAPFTGGLIFTPSDGSAPKPGPIGTIAADDPNTVTSLSADGQSYNIQSNVAPASGTIITLTWTDPAGVVPSFTAGFTDQAVAVTLTGSFSAPTPGTTV